MDSLEDNSVLIGEDISILNVGSIICDLKSGLDKGAGERKLSKQ